MASNFPLLKPASISIALGSFPASVSEAMSGRLTVVRHSDNENGIQWATEFIVTYEQWEDLRDHFTECGTIYGFLFDPFTLDVNLTPSGYKWWYNQEPTCTDVFTDLFSVEVSFRCDFDPLRSAPTAWEYYFLRGATADYAPLPSTAPESPTLNVASLSSGVTTDGFVEVTGLAPGASWEYSIDSGATWSTGPGAGFRLPTGDYGASQVRVRQTDGGGTSPAAVVAAAFYVAPPGSAVIAFSAAPGATSSGTVTLPLAGQLVWIRLGWASWFSLYASAAAAAADTARPHTSAPELGRGICCDPRLLTGDPRLDGMHLLPFEDFKNEENPAIGTYYWKHRNEDLLTRDYRIILQFRN